MNEPKVITDHRGNPVLRKENCDAVYSRQELGPLHVPKKVTRQVVGVKPSDHVVCAHLRWVHVAVWDNGLCALCLQAQNDNLRHENANLRFAVELNAETIRNRRSER